MPITKIDRNVYNYYFNQSVPCYCNHNKNKNKAVVTKISDKLWDMISALLPKEKPNNKVGRPAIPFRKIMNGIVYVLRTKRCQWKMLPSEYGSDSLHVTADSSNGMRQTPSRKYGPSKKRYISDRKEKNIKVYRIIIIPSYFWIIIS